MAGAGLARLQRARRRARAIVSQHLEEALTRRFGLEWVARDDRHGFEIKGISGHMMRLFSSRRESITADLRVRARAYETRYGRAPSQRELVGLILARRGLRRSAKWTCREQWLLHDKLVIGFDDEDYRQMLLSRRAGGDPSDLVRQRMEDFRLAI